MNTLIVLVTGATGFIGQKLCRSLLEVGYSVRGTYRRPQPAMCELPQVDWIQISDINSDTCWTNAVRNVGYVIHLAALAHQVGGRGEGRLDEFMAINAEGTACLAKAVARQPTIKRFLFVSSIAAVCSFSDSVISAQTPPHPDTDYGRSKLAAEEHVRAVLAHGQPDWCILRPPLVYGPGNPGNMSRLLKLVNTGIPLPLKHLENKRTFIYVGNLIEAVERCLWHPGASRRTFLVGDSETLSTPELIQLIAQKTEKAVRLFAMPPNIMLTASRAGNLLSRVTGWSVGLDSYSLSRLTGSLYLDTSDIRESIEWSPSFTLADGLDRTLFQ